MEKPSGSAEKPTPTTLVTKRVYLGSPFSGENKCVGTVTVGGTLMPAAAAPGVSVKIKWTNNDPALGEPADAQVDNVTSTWSKTFTNVAAGDYSIEASETGATYLSMTSFNVHVKQCMMPFTTSLTKARLATSELLGLFLLEVTDKIPDYIDDALYVVIALEKEDRTLFGVRSDKVMADGAYLGYFWLVPRGQYYARITIVRLFNPPELTSMLIDVA